MLGSRNSGSRHTSPSESSISWQEFARDEGRKSAADFLDRLKQFRENNEDVPESICVREFATSLTESLAGLLDRCNSPSRSSLKPEKSKHWWKIFKRGRSSVRRKSSRDASNTHENTRQIILDRTVTQMNLQDGNIGEWIKCRLVLVGFHDNYHIEVYCPPKTVIPKITLFCFLIEEVRSTTTLEAPDSDSSFVVKSRSHGEYVFDAGSQMDKDLWIDIINKYTTTSASTQNNGGQMPGSMSLGAICDSNGSIRSTGRSNSKISRSRSQTPIPRATSPLVETYHRVPSFSNSQPESSSPFVRNCNERRRVGLDGSIPSLPRPTYHKDSSPSHSQLQSSDSDTPQTINIPTINGDTSSSPPNIASGTSISSQNSMTSHSSPHKRKTSAPSTVTMSLGNRDDSMFNSNEALGRVGSDERLSFVNFPVINSNGGGSRCHSRQRSFDSSLNHTTDGSLANNRFTINVGSQERLSNGTSGPSSAFSSAGNLHDVRVTSPVLSAPDRMTRLETTSQTSSTINPVYIETNGEHDHQISSYTDLAPNSWANTQTDLQNLRFLSQYHWFHGMISRNVATHLVLDTGTRSSGQYLVRQSESREGDFVLTYNCQNRSKHLRLTIDQSGCNIQHLWFEDVLSMLEYFKTHPIPLDSMPATDDVKLINFVDRSASDNFRSTTIVNIERIQRNAPRRHHSMHVSSSRGIDGVPLSQSSNNSQSQTPTRNWRQIFSRQNGRSSSSQSIRSHATVQRTQSANAGSLQEIPMRRRGNNHNKENNYVTRMY